MLARRATGLALLVAAAAAGANARQPVDAGVAITNVTVVTPGADAPLARATIVVHGGLVAAVGPAVRAPDGARVIDGAGRYAVPGLWDMHAHLAALTAIGRAPERYVGHGVLHVRDMGGLTEELFPLRDAVHAGRRVGPRMVLAGPTLNSEQPAAFHRKLTTPAEARAAVRELERAGVDFLKVHRATTREVFFAIVDEARAVSLPVAGHVPLALSWAEGARAGMRSIEHIQTIFENLQPGLRLTAERFTELARDLDGALGDEIFSVLKASGTYFDPTLVGYEATIDGSAPAVATARRQAYARMKTIAAKAARAGVPIVTGTDVLDRHGEMLLQELERLVEIGMTPQAVLTAATATSAAAARRPEAGRIAAGGPASFLLVDANPLDDVRHLRRLSAVVVGGRVLSGEALAALRQ